MAARRRIAEMPDSDAKTGLRWTTGTRHSPAPGDRLALADHGHRPASSVTSGCLTLPHVT